MLKQMILILGAFILPMTSPAMTPAAFDELLAQLEEHQRSGEFNEAMVKAQGTLESEDSLTNDQRRALEFEVERTRRIERDYSLSESRLREILKGEQGVQGVTDEEITAWIEEGRFDFLEVDGQKRFVGASRPNLFFRYPELRARAKDPSTGEWYRFLLEHARGVRAQIEHPAQDTADPIPYEVDFTLTVKGGEVPDGEIIRAWMPYPQQFNAQQDVRLLSASPDLAWMNAPDYPMRSLYFEAPSNGEEDTVFQASYTVTVLPRFFRLDAERVAAARQFLHPEATHWTQEQPPHVVFTPRIQKLAAEIVGEETNPMLKARAIYDWIADNKVYSYAREYSTLRCIPEYVLDTGYGDCGQIALLYITLCRAAGVPARWQSGWVMYPEWENLHDWTEIYLAPYGWVPVDPDFAMGIETKADKLTRSEKDELRGFYFGGLDGFRLTINRDHGFPHYPPKEDFRSDTVDFQRGEVEATGKNIYYGRFRYNLEKKILSGPYATESANDKQSKARPADPGAAR